MSVPDVRLSELHPHRELNDHLVADDEDGLLRETSP